MTNIEKAAESACGHLVGLYLSSGNAYCGATGWRSPKPLDLLPDVVSSYSYQLLPLDCKPDLVQRINLRYDHIIPCNRRDVAQFLWESGTDVEVMKKRQTVKEKLENFKVDKVSVCMQCPSMFHYEGNHYFWHIALFQRKGKPLKLPSASFN